MLILKQFSMQGLTIISIWTQYIYTNEFDRLLPSFDPSQQRTILRAREQHISSWLSVMPVKKSQFDLSAQEFRDGLALRYRKPLLLLIGSLSLHLIAVLVVLLVGDIMKFVMPFGT